MMEPKIRNIMATVDLGCRLDLAYIASHYTEYCTFNPSKFNPIVMRLQLPKSTSLIFGTGKLVLTGTCDEKTTEIAAHKYASLIAELKFPVRFLNFRITNIVASGQLSFPPPLFNNDFLPSEQMKLVEYEPEIFPGLLYRNGVTIIIFRSGKVIITNAKTREQIYEAYVKFEKSINRKICSNFN